jgi:hypothetical protein
LTNRFPVKFVPIDYGRREGTSKIRPIRDTANFFNLIVRTVLYFRPLKVFVPFAMMLYTAAGVVVARDLYANKRLAIGDMAVILFLAAVQVLITGFLADLACDAFRHRSSRRSSNRWRLYENPLGFFMLGAGFLFAIAMILYVRDVYVIKRNDIPPKTLLMFVTTLQFFSTGLLADLIQRRGRLK